MTALWQIHFRDIISGCQAKMPMKSLLQREFSLLLYDFL